MTIGVGTGGGLGTLIFFKAGSWPLHFCISYCVANILIDNLTLRHRYLP